MPPMKQVNVANTAQMSVQLSILLNEYPKLELTEFVNTALKFAIPTQSKKALQAAYVPDPSW